MTRFAAMACAFGALAIPALGQQMVGPTPYLSLADSPWTGIAGFTADDLEDGLLNITGVTASGNGLAITLPSSQTDSVDGDNGPIDGSGTSGISLFAAAVPGITLTFDATLIGTAPTYVGLVWTDGANDITFTAFDTAGNLIGTLVGTHADTQINGGTDEDRFYGVIFEGGIGSVIISNLGGGIEIDHIQYATAPVPAPGAVGLIAAAGVLAARRRRS